MISFAVRVKENRVKGDLVKFRDYLGTITGNLLKQEACLTARAALKYAPPMVSSGGQGDKPAAAKMGERAIDKDVRSIFAPRQSTLQAVFAGGNAGSRSAFSKWKQGTPPASRSTLINKIYADSDDSRAYRRAKAIFGDGKSKSREINNAGQMRLIHNGQRRAGRVVRGNGPSSEIKRNPFIVKESLIKQYVKMRALQVGKLKSGWWEIISTHGRGLNIFGRTVDAGAKGLPKYITRHKGPGTLVAQLNGYSKRVTITNRIGDNDGAGLRAGTYGLVIAHRNAALAKRPYQAYADRLVRNWNSMLPPSA